MWWTHIQCWLTSQQITCHRPWYQCQSGYKIIIIIFNLFSGLEHKETSHSICSHVLWTPVDWSGQFLPHWCSVDGWQLSRCAAAAVTCRPQRTGQSLRPDLTVMDGSVSLSGPPPKLVNTRGSTTHARYDRWEDSMSTAKIPLHKKYYVEN